ncbi:MAG TPA: lipase maturation factor family protein, partial [Chthoniobacterales bacterium]
MIYDGDCRFCGKWIRRWKESTGEKVEYARSQDVGADFPEIPAERYDAAVQWVEPGGQRAEGAEAVFRVLATANWRGRLLLWLFLKVGFFAWACRSSYAFVARHRAGFSLLTRWLWGESVERPTYAIASWLFLRALAVIYLIAFFSYWRQTDGLISSTGILPFQNFLLAARENLGMEAFWKAPTLGWLWQHDALPHLLCAGGVVLSVGLFFGWLPGPILILLWAFYLSLTVMGQVFYNFQWDVLLLEAGFLAIFVAPWHRATWRHSGNPPSPARLLMVWLLFRLIFSAGVVKFSSGDSTWAQLTALDFHFWTQPIPDWIAWYANLLPAPLKTAGVVLMFGVELLLPLLFFTPRRLRFVAFSGTVLLQLLILATGNYGFFNLLTLALALWLMDDLQWPGGLMSWVGSARVRYLPRRVAAGVALAIFVLTLAPFLGIFRQPMPLLRPLEWAYGYIAPFRSINGYGLFAVMTTQRR